MRWRSDESGRGLKLPAGHGPNVKVQTSCRTTDLIQSMPPQVVMRSASGAQGLQASERRPPPLRAWARFSVEGEHGGSACVYPRNARRGTKHENVCPGQAAAGSSPRYCSVAPHIRFRRCQLQPSVRPANATQDGQAAIVGLPAKQARWSELTAVLREAR